MTVPEISQTRLFEWLTGDEDVMGKNHRQAG